MRNMTEDQIAEYISIKLEETSEDDVFPFNAELVTDEFPVMVKFHETWCSRCHHMKSAFEYAASKTVGRVMFMEVECSSSVETRKFCGKHRVDGFPTLKLMVAVAAPAPCSACRWLVFVAYTSLVACLVSTQRGGQGQAREE
jgi:thioredoxin-like negative regulator of GroEL